MRILKCGVTDLYAGAKSIVLSVLLAGVLAACQEATEPLPPQSPPTPQTSPLLEQLPRPDKHAAEQNTSGIETAVFKYKASTQLHFHDAQGKPIKRFVIHT